MGSAEWALLSNLNYRGKDRETVDGDTETEENMHGKLILDRAGTINLVRMY